MFFHTIKVRTFFLLFILLFQSVAICADISGPNITLLPNEVLKSLDRHEISVNVTDEGGVKSVLLYYRIIGSGNSFETRPLYLNSNNKFYSTYLVTENLYHSGVEFYIEAKDYTGNISQDPFPDQPRQVFYTEVQTLLEADKTGSSTKKWWWIGLGVLATGALLSAASDGGNDNDDSITLTIEAPAP